MLVKVRGWRPGLITIDLINAIKEAQSLGLAESRRLAHAIVDNEPIDFEFESPESAEQFREKITALGVITEKE